MANFGNTRNVRIVDRKEEKEEKKGEGEEISEKWLPVLMAIVALLAGRTFLRTLNWQRGLVLYGHDIKLNPEAFDLQNNYGVELVRFGRIEEAKPYFEKSIVLAPNWWTNYSNLGVVYQRKGDLVKAKELYRKAIENGDYYLAFENLAGLSLKTESPEETIAFLRMALIKFPANQTLRRVLVIALSRKADFQLAEKEAEALYQLFPSKENALLREAIRKRQKI